MATADMRVGSLSDGWVHSVDSYALKDLIVVMDLTRTLTNSPLPSSLMRNESRMMEWLKNRVQDEWPLMMVKVSDIRYMVVFANPTLREYMIETYQRLTHDTKQSVFYGLYLADILVDIPTKEQVHWFLAAYYKSDVFMDGNNQWLYEMNYHPIRQASGDLPKVEINRVCFLREPPIGHIPPPPPPSSSSSSSSSSSDSSDSVTSAHKLIRRGIAYVNLNDGPPLTIEQEGYQVGQPLSVNQSVISWLNYCPFGTSDSLGCCIYHSVEISSDESSNSSMDDPMDVDSDMNASWYLPDLD
jgi:hypothetical protein